MKIVLSPAKKLNLNSSYPKLSYTKPVFLDQAQHLIEVLRQKSPDQLKLLMKISDNLAQMNWERYQQWHKEIDPSARPAIFTFNGQVYEQFDALRLPKDKLPELNKRLRILSGLYGILKPFDLIYPYRLEMGTKLSFNGYKNLYDYWRMSVTKYLNNEMPEGDFLVNLASQEYFKVIDRKIFKHPIYDVIFKDYKNGELKTIAIYAKMARGLMTRFITLNNINTPEELKLFNLDGYRYDANLSAPKKLVFTR